MKDLQQTDPHFQVNSIGAVLLAKHLLPLLKHSDRNLFTTMILGTKICSYVVLLILGSKY